MREPLAGLNRRTFVRALAGALVAPSFPGFGQQRRAVPGIGVLSPAKASTGRDGLIRALREFGYVEGRNAVIEYRWAELILERFPELAAELVRLRVDVIVARGSEATQAARQATSTIPIVAFAGDPVAAGFVASLTRPGGNVTAISQQMSDLAPKYLQLLRDVLPQASEVAILWSPVNASSARFVRDANDAAVQSHMRVQAIAIATVEDLDRAFTGMERAGLRAMLVPSIPIIFDQEARIARFAIKNRIATLSLDENMVEEDGFLMFYGSTSTEQWRQIADYVDKILKGAKPADLPVQQGTKFELILNLKTAKAIGLTVPKSLLLRADRVIQ